eukprot:jgi/Astpho2/3130/Aster-03414
MKRGLADMLPSAARGLEAVFSPSTRLAQGCVRPLSGALQGALASSATDARQLHACSGWALQPGHASRVAAGPAGASSSHSSEQRRGMFIQVQGTPNPASNMFVPGRPVLDTGSQNFSSPREAMKSPLAKRLFQIDGVTNVFFGTDFVTVTKDEEYTWSVLKPDVFAAIMDHFTSGDPLLLDDDEYGASDTAIQEDDSDVVAMIKELLETRIRPAVMEDGGDIVFQGFDENSGIVKLKMQGACSGCPSSAVTLKSGIENMLKHYIPEVKSVMEGEPDAAEKAGLSEFNKLEQHLSN